MRWRRPSPPGRCRRKSLLRVRRPEPGRRVPFPERRGNHRQRPCADELVTLTVVFAGLAGGILWNLTTWFLGIPVEFVARPDRWRHRLDAGRRRRARRQMARPRAEGHHPRRAVADHRAVHRRYRYVPGVPNHPGRQREDAHARFSDRPDRIGVDGLVGARHERRPEDDGHHHPRADRQPHVREWREGAVLGDRVSCALAISLGTYVGGWRVIRTLGKGLVEIDAPQGMAAESSSAAVILLSSHFGYSLSTTHVATGSILGSGVGKKGAEVRWNVAGRMATAWVITLPAAGAVGALAYYAAHGIGGSAGVLIMFLSSRRVARVLLAVTQDRGDVEERQRRLGRIGRTGAVEPRLRYRCRRPMNNWINLSALVAHPCRRLARRSRASRDLRHRCARTGHWIRFRRRRAPRGSRHRSRRWHDDRRAVLRGGFGRDRIRDLPHRECQLSQR